MIDMYIYIYYGNMINGIYIYVHHQSYGTILLWIIIYIYRFLGIS